MAARPTERTIQRLSSEGIKAGIVERFNPHVGPHGIRQDLFGFIDVIALDSTGKHTPDGSPRAIAIQVTSGSHAAEHVKKIREAAFERASFWIKCGGIIQVWAWSKKLVPTLKGGKKIRYHLRIVDVTLDMLTTP
jgi:hypothetical protein